MSHHQTSPMIAGHAAPDVSQAFAERRDDPCARIHRYQQQLRAELLAGASDSARRPASRWQWPWKSAIRPGLVIDAALAMESRLKALTEAGAGRFAPSSSEA